MEELFKKVHMSKALIVILLCIVVAMYATQAYYYYWEGRNSENRFRAGNFSDQ